MNTVQKITGLSAALYLGVAIDARADVVSDWNAIAVQTIVGGGRPPGGAPFLDIATVHLAVHDAVAAIDGQFHPYYARITGASGSPAAAAAKAAHDVLVTLLPALAVSAPATFNSSLALNRLSQNDPGVTVG